MAYNYLNKLEYLIQCGYSQNIVKSFKDYCIDEIFDEEGTIDDLDTCEDSSIIEHLQDKYKWTDPYASEFFFKARQAFGIDDPPLINIKNGPHSHKNGNIPPIIKKAKYSKGKPAPVFATGGTSRGVSAYNIDYNLTPNELLHHKKVYFSQCKNLLPSDQRTGDEALLRVLSMGRKNNTPLLQNIADTYSRTRINTYLAGKSNGIETLLKESDFASNYPLFNALKAKSHVQNVNCLTSALQSFHRRICPKICFNSLYRINDSLPQFFDYVSEIITFIHNLVTSAQALPPFQVDFWIIPKDIISGMKYKNFTPNPSDTDSDDPDSSTDDDSTSSTSSSSTPLGTNDNISGKLAIGDIHNKLKYEKLIHHTSTIKYNSPNIKKKAGTFQRELDDEYKQFMRKLDDANKKKNKKNKKNKKKNKKNLNQHNDIPLGPHNKRLIVIIDRRKPGNSNNNNNNNSNSNSSSNSGGKKDWDDKIYFYLPPDNCSTINDNHPRELFFNLSKECVLPGKGYNNGKRNNDDIKLNNDNDNTNDPDIQVTNALGGYQFTLSFHVEAADDIKCYLFWMGWISRFFPQDMIEVWPLWFEHNTENDKFIKQRKWVNIMNKLQTYLCDNQFKQWYFDSTNRKDLLKKYK